MIAMKFINSFRWFSSGNIQQSADRSRKIYKLARVPNFEFTTVQKSTDLEGQKQDNGSYSAPPRETRNSQMFSLGCQNAIKYSHDA